MIAPAAGAPPMASAVDLVLTGAAWRALAPFTASGETRYAMQDIGWFTCDDKARAWVPRSSGGVACATDGKAMLMVAADDPGRPGLFGAPKVGRGKAALASCISGARPLCAGEVCFPPALDVLPTVAEYTEGYEVSADALRALCAIASMGDETDVVRMWMSDRGIHAMTRRADLGVSARADAGEPPSEDEAPIGLDARYLRLACDAADGLGSPLVRVRTARRRDAHRRAVMIEMVSGAGVVMVMPLNLDT